MAGQSPFPLSACLDRVRYYRQAEITGINHPDEISVIGQKDDTIEIPYAKMKKFLKHMERLQGIIQGKKQDKKLIEDRIMDHVYNLLELVEDSTPEGFPEGVGEASIKEGGGTFMTPAGEAFGKGKGLNENDREIVWPPAVIIFCTEPDKYDNRMWVGRGDAEVVEYFNSFGAVGAQRAYDPQGHRRMSVLIFEASALGFMKAERLSKHLEDKGTDREGCWCRSDRVQILPTGQRQLYGYMAEKDDMAIFNKHAKGESKLKFEMRSYQEMVDKAD